MAENDTQGLLADPADLAVHTRLPADSPRLELAVRRASDRFIGEVGHPVVRVEDDTVELDGNGRQVLHLPAAPIEGTPTVSIDGDTITDFQLSLRHGILRRRDGRWPSGLGNIEVTYTHGHRTIPGDIADAVLEHAATIATSLAHVQQESAGSNSVGFGTQAAVGVTQKWSDTVARHQLNTGDSA
ncbi:mobile element protein [Nesterenkonia sp. E16_7]|uniref:hypothetical protein n=1 Tax=unclassified Nesterenkonia TaxID=2629769 RepID=UPI001A936CFD|nr:MULTISPECIES: hypothetical protein [unclassified Nesterenkonia]MBO0596586.1 mobile element protein [Nesterenkonia sp. E16_10]MBO0598363.1 mobile element protein [Nesterenkonia sp. E16_7]